MQNGSDTPSADSIRSDRPSQRGQALIDTLAGFEPDFLAALERQRTDTQADQDREAL
jgi:antitoxin VapB